MTLLFRIQYVCAALSQSMHSALWGLLWRQSYYADCAAICEYVCRNQNSIDSASVSEDLLAVSVTGSHSNVEHVESCGLAFTSAARLALLTTAQSVVVRYPPSMPCNHEVNNGGAAALLSPSRRQTRYPYLLLVLRISLPCGSTAQHYVLSHTHYGTCNRLYAFYGNLTFFAIGEVSILTRSGSTFTC
ncbi:hypothetical protein BDW02DRAFT_60661 [Decorospora gaudefroyi]|uniref:Uncharacterized protein n=1 Tax=Decorospora gaudefroyi TaxID=184978 RepID=A0A6A5K8I2_9PLEO|nr:hypothetical protein BDW02DRAFT_60661 [Decorospora gaudefroyi]